MLPVMLLNQVVPLYSHVDPTTNGKITVAVACRQNDTAADSGRAVYGGQGCSEDSEQAGIP